MVIAWHSTVLGHQTRLRLRPQGLGHRLVSRPACNACVPSQYTFDVAIQNSHALAITKRGYCRSSGAPHANQLFEFCCRFWKFAAKFLHDLIGRTVQIASAGIVAQPCPSFQNIIQGRSR